MNPPQLILVLIIDKSDTRNLQMIYGNEGMAGQDVPFAVSKRNVCPAHSRNGRIFIWKNE